MKVRESHFTFITKNNIHQFLYMLDKKIEESPAEMVQLLTIIVGSLPASLGAIVMEHYSSDVQAEVMVFLSELQQYEEDDIISTEQYFAGKLSYILGGETFVRRMLDRLDNEEKVVITAQVNREYPDHAQAINRLILIFDDLFSLEEKAFEKVFTAIDAVILAPALCGVSESQLNQIYSVLSSGMREMIDEFLSLRRDNLGRTETVMAQKFVIEYALDLERKGLIFIK